MARTKKKAVEATVKRTVTGKVVKVHDRSETQPDNPSESQQVQNLEMLVPSEKGEEFWEITGYGREVLAKFAGLRLDLEKNEWVQSAEPIRVGDRLEVSGNYRLKPWQAKKFGLVHKPCLTIYGAHQVKRIALPKLPWESAPVKKRKRKAV